MTITEIITAPETEKAECTAAMSVTELSEAEKAFTEKIKTDMEFIRPYIYRMDREASMDADDLKMLREKGYLALEIPRQYGGSELPFFNVILAIEHTSAIDSSVGAFVDV